MEDMELWEKSNRIFKINVGTKDICCIGIYDMLLEHVFRCYNRKRKLRSFV